MTESRESRPGALDRARKDLDAGRLDLARDRVTGFLYTLHRQGRYCEEAYLLLAEIFFAMRDLPRAGAAWLLTARQDEQADQAVAALRKRFGSDRLQLLRVVKPRAPSELYPEVVQQRLREWGYQYVPYRPRSNPHVVHELSEDGQKGVRPVEWGCLITIVFGLLAMLIYGMRVLGIF